MAHKKVAGLIKRGNVWYVNKRLDGRRIRESTGTGDLVQAEFFLARLIDQTRQAKIYGVRPKRTFRDAGIKYLLENQHKASIGRDKDQVKRLDVFVGELALESIHMGTLADFIAARREEGVKSRTINYALQVTRRILNLAATEWVDDNGLTWLLNAPKIKLLSEPDLRKPYPLSWEEQTRLFNYLPLHLRRMALFAVNTGCRDAEICSLKWEWEVQVPEIQSSVFIIPGRYVKNRDDRLVVLNNNALTVINEVRGLHPEYVFTYRGHRVTHMLNSGWKAAREKANLAVRVHDLKHTFGRRLRAAGVSFEDRQDLLGHRSGRITTHYSAAELRNLIDAANKVCAERGNTPVLTLLKSVGSQLRTVAYNSV